MNGLSPNVGAPALPQVSLIPPEFGRRRQRARLRLTGVFILVVALGGVVFGWFVSLGINTVAESGLNSAQDQRAQVAAEVASYDYVNIAQLKHETGMNAQAWAGATDVQWDDYLTAISAVLPTGVQLNQIQMTQATPLTGFNFSSGTPFEQTDLGQLAFTGKATSPELVAQFVNNLSALSGFAEVFVGSARIEQVVDSEQPLWAFDVSARVTLNALSGRFVIPVDGQGQGTGQSAEPEGGVDE